MGRLVTWLFGALVWAFTPGRTQNLPAPTRATAWRLTAIGVLVTFVGAVAISQAINPSSERQNATITGRREYAPSISNSNANSNRRIPDASVLLRLADGTKTDVELGQLYDAIGTRTGLPVQVDIRPSTDSINAVYFEGRRYGTGNYVAVTVVSVVFLVLGLGALLSGIGRLRRLRYISS